MYDYAAVRSSVASRHAPDSTIARRNRVARGALARDPGIRAGHDFSLLPTTSTARATKSTAAPPVHTESTRGDSPSHDRMGRDGVGGGGGAVIGALGGAAIGGGIGLAFGGLLGGLIGAGIGALVGGIAGYVAGRRSATVNVTRLAGVANTTDADLATANTVLSQAGISVSKGNEKTLSAAESGAILGGDNTLAEFSGPSLTGEEAKLLAYNRTSGHITGYWVPALSAGSRGEAMTPSQHGVTDASIVISSSARAPDSFAHELGHCLLDDGVHSADPNNLMASGSIRNFTDKLTDAQIKKMQSSKYV